MKGLSLIVNLSVQSMFHDVIICGDVAMAHDYLFFKFVIIFSDPLFNAVRNISDNHI